MSSGAPEPPSLHPPPGIAGRVANPLLLGAAFLLVASVLHALYHPALQYFPSMPEWVEGQIDAVVITLVVGVLYYVLVHRPLTRAGEAAVASDARHRATIQAMSEGVMLFDGAGVIIDANPAAERILGIPREAMLGRSGQDAAWDLRSGEGAAIPPAESPARRALATGQGVRGTTLGVRRPDGRRVWLEVATEPLFLAGAGTPTHAVATLTDVTERRRAEELRRALAEIDRQIIGRLDLDGILDTVCRGVVSLGFRLAWIGFARPDGSVEVRARAGPATGYLDGYEARWDDSPLGRGPVGAAIRTGEPAVVVDAAADEHLAPWRAALERYGLRSGMAFPLRAGDGAVDGVLVAYAAEPDVVDRLLMEELRTLAQQSFVAIQAARTHGRLAESEEQHRLIVETTIDHAIFALDPEGRIKSWNRGAERIYGYAAGEAIGQHVRMLAMEEDRQAGRPETDLAGALRDGHALWDGFACRRDGPAFYASVVLSAMRDPGGKHVGFSMITRDRTAERQAGEAMRRVTLAIEQSEEAVFMTDPEGTIGYVNPAFCRLSGLGARDILGKSTRTLRSDAHDRGFYREITDTLGQGRTWKGVISNRRADGTLYHLAMTIGPVRDERDRIVHFVGVGRDVTRETLLEAQLRQAQKLEAVGQLAGGVAHDFNNALAGVIGYADLATMEATPENPLREHVAEIRRCADRAAGIARQLLIFSRRQTACLKVSNLNDIVGGLAKMLRRLIGEDVALDIALAPDIGAVRADAGQIEQVLLNLCVNARDAMPGGGRLTIATANVAACPVPPSLPEDASAKEPPGWVVLTVADTGCGMGPEVKAHLFEPFFTTKPKGKGTGLGLSVVHGIVVQHGGRIEVESEPGRGTTFRICLPRVDAEPRTDALPDAAAALPRGTETVLVVDDEEGVRAVVSRVLERHGYRVLTAASGYEALGLAEHHPGPIALLVTDVIMPPPTGPEVARELTAKRPSLRVLYISGYGAERIGDAPTALGAPLLPKPFSPADLLRRVREALDRPA